MKREKNYKTAKFVEALEHIDVKYIEEAGKKIKERPMGHTVAGMSRAKSLRQVLALVACVLLLSAVIPAVTYLMGHLPDILGSSTGDDTTEQTSPETPPEETSSPAPETSVNTDHETTAPLYDGTTAPPEPEHNGSYGLEYKMNEDGRSAMLFHRGICTDENVIVASVWNNVPVTIIGEVAFADYIKYKTITIPDSVTAIDMRAFKNCTGLESVVLHDGISYIGADAFENCVALTEITLPKSLEWIQTGLFTNCINLEKVIIGNEVERIVFGAFYDCSALRELHYLGTKAEWNKIQKDLNWNTKSAITVVHCSDGDVEIIPYTPDETVYDGSRGLEYKVNNDGKTASLFGIGTCTDTEIVVASTYNGLPVTEIFYNAFNGNSQIVSVIIPESVTYIDKRAFANCSSLQSITLPSGLKNFGEAETFKNCTSLKTIVLPDGMNYLGVETFKGCTSLESIVMKGVGSIDISAFEDCIKLNNIVISGKCIEISDSAFKNCRALTKFSFDGTVSKWKQLEKENEWNEGCPFTVVHCSDGDVDLIEYDGSRGLEYKIDGDHAVLVGIGTCTDKEITVASTYNGLPVTSVDYSFSKISNVTSITLSDSVLTVGGIDNMPDLVSVYFSKSVEGINPESLIGCPKLEVIEVDKENQRYMSAGNCLIEKATKTIFHGCKGSVIPSDGSVTVIGEFSFHGCDWLTELTVPKNIERIDSYAFAGCDNLKKVILPDSLTYLGFGAFAFCESLESVTFGKNLETIGGSVFEDCPKLRELHFPRTLKFLGSLALDRCYSLAKVSFAGTMREWNAIEKTWMWYGGERLFTVINCSDGDVAIIDESDGSQGLEYLIDGDHAILVGIGTCTDTDIVVASTYNGVPVTEIGERAFADCFSIVTVTVPEGVKIIGNDAFNFCRSLTKVTLPTTIEAIGDRAFFECVRVEEFKGSENIITIGANAFDTCNSITSIKLGNKLQKIGSEAFKSCMSLKEITVPASVTSLGDGVFAGCSSLMKAVILPNTDILGKSFFSSCGLLREVTLPDGLKEISRDAFHACASLSEINIPESVSTIGEAAFAYCHSLQTVTLPTRLTSLGMSVFQGSGIVEIVIPSGVGEIPGSAFGECISLTKIVIPEGVTRIQNEAFYRCSKLTSISIPSSVTGIGSEAFAKSALTEIVIPDNVTWIWEAAFRECKNLSSVKLGKKLELIMEAAFADCTRLESVRIPASVKEVSNGAFVGCSSLKSVTIERGIERFGTGIFVQCHDLTEIVFTGTVAEWRKIEIPERAFGHMPNEIIRCSDGDFFTHSDIPAAYRDILFGDAKFVFDSKEIRLDEFRFPSGGALITLCADVKYAVVDMDRDGLPEVVITGDVGDMLVLHEKGGKVYGFDFTFRNMDRIKTDGSFEWNDTTAEGLCYGDSRLSFPKGKCTVTDICSVVGDSTDSVKYFVGGAETTRDSYLRTADTVSKTEVEWYPLDRYPVAS